MPIEVRELVIKAQVGNTTSEQGTTENNTPTHSGQDEIIKQCVEQVLEIIKEKEER